ncbi:hypothetical protein WM18_16550 [Burkholderia ubonensis]|nr:hypothetical protein WM18_16550 [Burkholderia ubonensis]
MRCWFALVGFGWRAFFFSIASPLNAIANRIGEPAVQFAIGPANAPRGAELHAPRKATRPFAQTHGLVAQGNDALQVGPTSEAVKR